MQPHGLDYLLTGNKAEKRLGFCATSGNVLGGCQLPWDRHLHISVHYLRRAASCEDWPLQLSPKRVPGKQVKPNPE